MKGPVIVWTANLSLFVLPALVGVLIRHGRFGLCYHRATWAGAILIWLLRTSRVIPTPACRVAVNDEVMRFDNPNSRRLNVQASGPIDFNNQFWEAHSKLMEQISYPDSRVGLQRVLTNLMKSAGSNNHQLFEIVETARQWSRSERVGVRLIVIVAPTAELAKSLPVGWAGPDVAFASPWDYRHSRLAWLLRFTLQGLKLTLRYRRQKPSRPFSIATSFAWGFDRSARLNDLFWWWNSGIPGERTVLLFDHPAHPATQEVVEQARHQGIECALMNPSVVGDSAQPVWKRTPGLKISFKRLWWALKAYRWGVGQAEAGRWISCQMLEMLYHSQDWEDFLTDYNVVALFHYQDAGPDYLSLACDSAGAARIGYHWSYQHLPIPYAARIHQVYFSWGQHYVKVMAEVGSCVDHILMSGCIVQGAYPNSVESDNSLGPNSADVEELSVGAASRTIVLFDASTNSDKFYEFFFRRIVDDPRWAVIIKPKSAKSDPAHLLPATQSIYAEASATGRVLTLDWQTSPADAARAANFAVSLDINSAGVVAALAGRRSIHLDYLKLHASSLSDWAKLYQAGPDRLVFDDPNRLWDELNKFFDEPGSSPDLGLADEQLLRSIDPFGDSGAGERIGTYVRWYLDGRDNQLSAEEALVQSDTRYTKKWGEDKVVNGAAKADTPQVISVG